MNSSKIIKLIRRLVREEVHRAVKPMVNEVLAEQFIRVLGQKGEKSGQSLTSVLGEVERPQPPAESGQLAKRQAHEKQQLQERIQKLSGGDPMAKMIFEDIDDRDRAAVHAPVAPGGGYTDMDEEGVDLSRFGY